MTIKNALASIRLGVRTLKSAKLVGGPKCRVALTLIVCAAIAGGSLASGATSTYINNFADALESNLKNSEGYAFAISYKNQLLETRSGGMARTTANAPALAMSPDVKFSIASMSKTSTAVAALQLLVPNQFTSYLNNPIGDFLPSDFTPDAAFKAITFKQLLQHKSGIIGNNQLNFDMTYQSLKTYVNGHPNVSNQAYNYSNVNYALFRLLIPKLANTAPLPTDQHQDEGYAQAYMNYVQQHVFDPLGFGPVSTASDTSTGVNYAYLPPATPGAGLILPDLKLQLGSQGWVLSTQQLSRFLRELNYGGSILSPELSFQMKIDSMGYQNGLVPTGGSQFLFSEHGGFYPVFYSNSTSACNNQNGEFNGELFTFTNDVSVALIVNSNLIYKATPNACPIAGGPLQEGSTAQAVLDAFNSTIATYPAVTGLSPSFGPEVPDPNNSDVLVTGAGFPDVFAVGHTMNVFFGSTSASYVRQSNSAFVSRSPGGTGVVNVIVEVDGIRSFPGPGNRYIFAEIPTITSISSTNGPITGGSVVQVNGTNFATGLGNTVIKFGPNPALNVNCTATVCLATTPSGISPPSGAPAAGTVAVTATVGGYASQNSVRFTYTAVISSVGPSHGPEAGGTKVTLTGAGFVPFAITFGSNPTSGWSCTSTSSCSGPSPAGNGSVDVIVMVDGIPSQKVSADHFTYDPGTPRGWTQWYLTPPEFANPGDTLTDDSLTREILYLVPHQGANDAMYAWDPNTQGWKLKTPLANPRPSKGAFAFHTASGKAVLFGGLIDTVTDSGDGNITVTYATDNTTWIWDGFNWTATTPAVSPSARYRASIAYDVAHGKVVLFGGCHDYRCLYRLNDTWTWDGVNWRQEAPASSPSPRAAASLAYDGANGTTILFGGSTAGGAVADTWLWDGKNWSALHPSGPLPPVRLGAGLAYSRADAGLVLYGGRTTLTPLPGTTYLDDTWIWSGALWTQIAVVPTPKLNFAEIAGMVYDTALDAVVVVSADQVWTWGGAGAPPPPPPPTQ